MSGLPLKTPIIWLSREIRY